MILENTLCECGLRLSDDHCNEWEEDEKTGQCSRCRNRKRMKPGSPVHDEYMPNIETVAFVERDFVSPNHYE